MTTMTQPYGLLNQPAGFGAIGALIERVKAYFASDDEAQEVARLREFAAQYAETQPSYASDLRAAAEWYDVYK